MATMASLRSPGQLDPRSWVHEPHVVRIVLTSGSTEATGRWFPPHFHLGNVLFSLLASAVQDTHKQEVETSAGCQLIIPDKLV